MNEKYKRMILDELSQQFGINDDTAWDEWLRFSEIQAAHCLAVDESAVKRFCTWRHTKNPDDAWS